MFIVPVKIGRDERVEGFERVEVVEGVEGVIMVVNINFYYGKAMEYLDSKIFLKNK